MEHKLTDAQAHDFALAYAQVKLQNYLQSKQDNMIEPKSEPSYEEIAYLKKCYDSARTNLLIV